MVSGVRNRQDGGRRGVLLVDLQSTDSSRIVDGSILITCHISEKQEFDVDLDLVARYGLFVALECAGRAFRCSGRYPAHAIPLQGTEYACWRDPHSVVAPKVRAR